MSLQLKPGQEDTFRTINECMFAITLIAREVQLLALEGKYRQAIPLLTHIHEMTAQAAVVLDEAAVSR